VFVFVSLFSLGVGVSGGDAIAAMVAMGDAGADADDAIVAMDAIDANDADDAIGTVTSDAMCAVGCCPFDTCPPAGRRDAGPVSLPAAK
jgi:hypothetical protein